MWIDAPNLNSCWARLLVEELVRCGVHHFVVSPGSRSTPLTLAVAVNPRAESTVHFDERGAAFHALGMARAAFAPVALVCTSGSAVANYYPAVVEAAQSYVPLILLTADRPPELLDCGANQAIDQVKLFGGYPRWCFEIPCPTTEISPAFILTTADQAVHRSIEPPAGPVHLNCHFREPLAPTEDDHDLGAYLEPLSDWMEESGAYSYYRSSGAKEYGETTAKGEWETRGLIIVGYLHEECERKAVVEFARRAGWPVFADIGSGLRFEADAPFVPYYDQLLLSERFRAHCSPEIVLHVGGPVTSKRLLQFLGEHRGMGYEHVAHHPLRHDPNHQVTLRVETDIPIWCKANADGCFSSIESAWAKAIHRANAAAAECIAADIAKTEVTEAGVVREVCARVPANSALFLGNSMPIRDADMYAAPRDDAPRICVSRGASGIDGNIATAAGFARGHKGPMAAIIGDLAALHDLNSLALLRGLQTPFALVVINNDGGGIFHFLPVAEHEQHFEQYFGTPHGLGFAEAAAMFGLGYARPETLEDFLAAFQTALEAPTPVLIEVRTDRRANVAAHRRLQARVARCVEDAMK